MKPDSEEYTTLVAKMTITSLPPHKHLHFTILHKILMQVKTKSPRLAIFILAHKVFFCKPGSSLDFFPSLRFYFSMSHSNSPIVGVSDIGQLSTFFEYTPKASTWNLYGSFTPFPDQRKYAN